MLKTETNTPQMDNRVLAAFLVSPYRVGDADRYSTVFEHGQWWILDNGSDLQGRTFSVVDATGGPSVDGFDFEET